MLGVRPLGANCHGNGVGMAAPNPALALVGSSCRLPSRPRTGGGERAASGHRAPEGQKRGEPEPCPGGCHPHVAWTQGRALLPGRWPQRPSPCPAAEPGQRPRCSCLCPASLCQEQGSMWCTRNPSGAPTPPLFPFRGCFHKISPILFQRDPHTRGFFGSPRHCPPAMAHGAVGSPDSHVLESSKAPLPAPEVVLGRDTGARGRAQSSPKSISEVPGRRRSTESPPASEAGRGRKLFCANSRG